MKRGKNYELRRRPINEEGTNNSGYMK